MTEILRLNRSEIFFIFIDLQAKLLKQIPDASRIVLRNELLLEASKVMNVPYVATTQYSKGLGELDASFRAKLGRAALDKCTFSCAADAVVESAIQNLKRPCAVVSGVETHICVQQTTLDLLQQGYTVVVVADAIGARGRINHETGLHRMEQCGATVMTSEMIVYELIGRTDSEVFKKLLPMIKRASSAT